MRTNPPGRVAALQSGSIDAGGSAPRLTLQAKTMGFNLLLDYSTVLPQFFSSGIVTTRKFIREKPKIVENSVKTLLDSMRYMFSHEQGTVELMSRYSKIKDRDFLREYYREVLVKELNRDLYPHLDAVKFALELEKKTNRPVAKANRRNSWTQASSISLKKNNTERRKMFSIVLSLGTFFLLFAFPPYTVAQVSVRASYGSLGVSQVILPLGVRAGIFQKNGLIVEPVYIAGRSVSALVSGDVEFGLMGGPPAVLARLGGADVVMIAGRNGLDQILVGVSSIKPPADLIGKNVGISRFGTTSDYGARIGLKRLKLQPQKDVTLIQIGDTAARIGGMSSGALAAATLSVGEEEYIRKVGLHVLTDNADVEFPGNAIVTTQRYLKVNRETVKRFVRGLVDTISFVKRQPEKTKSLLVNIYRQTDETIIGKRYEAMLTLFPDYPYLTANAVRSFLEILREDGKLKAPLDPEAFLDMSLLHEVEKENKK